jgi:isopentenyl phosphate kinase
VNEEGKGPDNEGWEGFAEVWQEAVALNRLFMDALHRAGLPAISFPPSASAITRDGQVGTWDLTPLRSALQAGLLPVIYGDTVFDSVRGGTILSTEDLFDYLAQQLHPKRILLAGLEAGVWADYPACTQLIPAITPATLPGVASSLGGSSATDVTGGMASKVKQSLALAQSIPGLEVLIFSGVTPGAVQQALSGSQVGTVIRGV